MRKKNCIIASVGKKSLHRHWLPKTQNYDVHLIVYDDSYSRFKHDSAYISVDKGYKLKLVYRYLEKHPEYLAHYEYFFIPDDDILISNENIERLFELMQKYSLSIAQPALLDSYFTYPSLVKDKFTLLRYTNMVEMMLPCFSKDALKKVLFTFNENESGWGTDFHWGNIINITGKEMAVIDSIFAKHTRPIQSSKEENINNLTNYMQKYNLKIDIKEFGCIYLDNIDKNFFIKERDKYKLLKNELDIVANFLKEKCFHIDNTGLFSGKLGLSLFFINYYQLSGNRIFYDLAFFVFEETRNQIKKIKNNFSLSSGLPGIGWLVEYLAQNKYIENETDEILEEVTYKINSHDFFNYEDFSLDNGLIGIGFYYLARIKNSNFTLENDQQLKENEIFQKIIEVLQSYLQEKTKYDFPDINIRDMANFILLFAQYNSTKKHEMITLTGKQMKWVEKLYFHYLHDMKEQNLSLECLYNNLLFAYTLSQYFTTLNKKELQTNIIESILNYSKDIFRSNWINNSTSHELIPLAHIYFLFYQESKIDDFKNIALSFLDKVIYQKDKIKEELNHLITSDIKKLLVEGLMLSSILSDVKSDWTF